MEPNSRWEEASRGPIAYCNNLRTACKALTRRLQLFFDVLREPVLGVGGAHDRPVPLGSRRLLLLCFLDLRPAIAQRHGAVEDEFARRRIRIHAEIALGSNWQRLPTTAFARLGSRRQSVSTTSECGFRFDR